MRLRPRHAAAAAAVTLAAGAAGFFGVVPIVADASMNPVAGAAPAADAEAARLHRRLFVADLHSDLLLWARDPLRRHERGHTDVPRLAEGNVALQVFGAVTRVPRGQNYESNAGDSDRLTPLVVAQRWPAATWTSTRERALFQARRLREAAARSGGASR